MKDHFRYVNTRRAPYWAVVFGADWNPFTTVTKLAHQARYTYISLPIRALVDLTPFKVEQMRDAGPTKVNVKHSHLICSSRDTYDSSTK